MASKPNASKMGRPSIYTPELAEKICELIRDGVSERKICGMPGMPGAEEGSAKPSPSRSSKALAQAKKKKRKAAKKQRHR